MGLLFLKSGSSLHQKGCFLGRHPDTIWESKWDHLRESRRKKKDLLKRKKNTTILNLWLIMLQLPVADAADAAAAAVAKSLQSCLTLCDPIDGSPPGAPVPGILQARILEWVAISFSIKASFLKSAALTVTVITTV